MLRITAQLKRKTIKRLFSLLLVLAFFIMSTGFNAIDTSANFDSAIENNPKLFKELNEGVSAVIASIMEDPYSQYTQEEIGSMYVGQKFTIKNIDNSPEELIFYYPMISQECVIGIISVAILDEEIVSISAGKNFSSQLDKVLKESPKGVTLISDETGIKAINDKQKTYNIFETPSEITLQKHLNVDYGTYYSKNEVVSFQNISEKNLTFSTLKNITTSSTTSKYLSNYPIVA